MADACRLGPKLDNFLLILFETLTLFVHYIVITILDVACLQLQPFIIV